MPVGSTLEVTRLPAQGFPATKDVARGAASRKRGDGPPTHSICWEDYKPILRTLYIDEERPLREVMEIMENEFDFKATCVCPLTFASKASVGYRCDSTLTG